MKLLAGDLGGTKTLLGIYTWDNYLYSEYTKKYISADWSSFNSIISDFNKSLPINIKMPKHACLAVAGRVENNCCKLTNLNWEIDSNQILKDANLDSLEIINDFSVLIYGLRYLKDNQYVQIQGDFSPQDLISSINKDYPRNCQN